MNTKRLAVGLLALGIYIFTSSAVPALGAESVERWYAFYVAGGKAGYLHLSTTEGEEGGKTVWTTETELRFSMARLGAPLTIVQQETVVEDEKGQVLRFSSVTEQGGPPQMTKGTVADGKITIVQSGMERVVTYPEGALGPAAAQRLIIENPPKAGTVVKVVTFSTQAPDRRVVSTTTFGDMEKVDVLGRVVMLRKATEKNTLMPMETKLWADDEGEIFVIEMDMGMGPFRMLKTEKEIAIAESEPVEVFMDTLIEPNRPITEPRELKRAVYRIGNKTGATPAIYEGEGQSVIGEKDGKIDLQIVAEQPAPDLEIFSLPVPGDGLEKYLSPAPFIECNDSLVVQFAEEALGEETNALKAAALIQTFVEKKISKKSLNVGFASAAEVAKTLEGDCTEHAVLCCAIARARGLPARVVTGLVYLPPEGGIEKRWKNGFFGYHMWTEVLVADGVWFPVDAAIGTYDATHIALAKSDLSTGSPGIDMMIAMVKVMGTLTLEVIEP